VDPTLHATDVFEVPVTPGERMHDLTVLLNEAGTIHHVINGVGGPALPEASGVPSQVVSCSTPRRAHPRRLGPVLDRDQVEGGKPPVATGPHASTVTRRSTLPWRSIAARYSSQSECSPAMLR
jgi:hypothetical protein